MKKMNEYNIDLHIHGLYSGAVSKDMKPRVIANQASLKGLQGVGTGDILNQRWEKLFLEETIKEEDGFRFKDIKFILQTEVETNDRVHHVLIFPTMSQVNSLREKLKRKTMSLETDGRPKLWISSKELMDIVRSEDILIGPAHAFTPYTGFYSKYDSLMDGYGTSNIDFLELGLSADTDMADTIKELRDISFLSNSDAHSPWPNKLGREFNTFLIEDISFEEIRKAIKRRNGKRIVRNVGLDPREGKYHKTRCRKCYTFYEPRDAERFNWKCPLCGGIIKKGVDYRIKELSSYEEPIHPDHRPRYIHIIPLSEIISLAIKRKNVYSKEVQELWRKIIEKTGTEIDALINTSIEELREINATIAKYIEYFRKGMINYIPGGAGMYGQLIPPGEKKELKIYNGNKQKSLLEY